MSGSTFSATARVARLARGRAASAVLVDQCLSSLSNFAVVAAGLWLPLDDYGALGVAVVTYTCLIGLIRAFFLEPLTAEDRLSRLHGRSLRPVLAVAGGASVLLLAIGVLAGGPLRSCFLVLAAGLPLLMAQDTGRYIAFHRGRPRDAVLSDSVWLVVFFGVNAAWRLSGGALTLNVLFVSWVGAGAVAGFLFLREALTPTDDREPMSRSFHVRYGLDYTLGPLFQLAVQGSLALVVPLAAYGRLRAATSLMAPVTILFTATTSTLLASAVHRAREGAAALRSAIRLWRTLLVLVVVGYVLALVVALSRWDSLVPSAARQSIGLLPPIILGNFVLAIDTPTVLQLKALRQHRQLVRGRSVQAVLIALAPLAALAFGIVGGAWALAVAQTVGMLLRRALAGSELDERSPHVLGAAA